MSMNLRLSGFQKLAFASVIATWVMVVIGVIVRSTGSGMGCPDWPLCHGQVIPPLGDTAAWLESIHRWWGVVIGFLVLGLVISAIRTQRATRSIVVGSVVAFLIVGFQAYLGKVTVDMNNSAETVLAHLATAMILLGTFELTAAGLGCTRD
jgi:heme A synthase